MRMAVAPNPATGPAAAIVRTAATAGLERDPVGLRRRDRPVACRVQRVHVEGDVEGVHARRNDPGPGAERGHAGVRAEHARPEVGDPARGERPRLRLVEDLAPEESGVTGIGRRGVGRREEVRRPVPDDHREGHAPDVARGRRVRRVEVAVGVKPGDAEPRCRARPTDAGHGPRVRCAVTADDQQPRARAGSQEAVSRRVPRGGRGTYR